MINLRALVRGWELSRDNRLMFLSLLLWGSGEGLWFYIQPLYIQSLGADAVQIGLVLSLGAAAFTLTLLPGGWISDRYSRRKTMLGGYLLGIVGAMLLASAEDWRQLIPGFVLFYASGYCVPAIDSYIAHAAGGRDLSRVFSTTFAAYNIGLTFSPVLGGWLGEVFGLRTVFWISALLFAASTVAVWLVSEQPVTPHHQRPSHRTVLGHRPFWRLTLFFSLLFFALALGQPFAPNYLTDVYQLDLSSIGLLGTLNSLGGALLGLVLGRWWPGRQGLLIGQALVLVSLALFLNSAALSVLALAFLLKGASRACHALASAHLGLTLDPRLLGLGFGVYQTGTNAALVIVPYLAGWLYALRPEYPFWISALGIPLTIVLTAFLIKGR
ncbi:MAG: MFS transporter [Chloroflexi bacterium]|nr:MFS transporter [Chloroflexota bacterium]